MKNRTNLLRGEECIGSFVEKLQFGVFDPFACGEPQEHSVGMCSSWRRCEHLAVAGQS